MGFMISFAGNVTYPKALNIREVAAMVPQDRFFIEPDSPIWRRCRIVENVMNRHL